MMQKQALLKAPFLRQCRRVVWQRRVYAHSTYADW